MYKTTKPPNPESQGLRIRGFSWLPGKGKFQFLQFLEDERVPVGQVARRCIHDAGNQGVVHRQWDTVPFAVDAVRLVVEAVQLGHDPVKGPVVRLLSLDGEGAGAQFDHDREDAAAVLTADVDALRPLKGVLQRLAADKLREQPVALGREGDVRCSFFTSASVLQPVGEHERTSPVDQHGEHGQEPLEVGEHVAVVAEEHVSMIGESMCGHGVFLNSLRRKGGVGVCVFGVRYADAL